MLLSHPRSNLVDFPKPAKGVSKAKPKPTPKSSSHVALAETPVTALTRWIVNYFDNVPQPGMSNGLEPQSTQMTPSSASRTGTGNSDAFARMKNDAVIVSDRMPIILQHNGHSRTIVGYELTRNNTINLLIFDPAPAKKPYGDLRKAALAMYHRSAESTKHPAVNPRSQDSPASSSQHPSHSLASKTSRILQQIRHLSPKPKERSPSPASKRRRGSSGAGSTHHDASSLDPTGRPVKRIKGGESIPPAHEIVDITSDDDDDVAALKLKEKMTRGDAGENEDTSIIAVESLGTGSSGLEAPKRPHVRAKTEAEEMVDALDLNHVARLFRVNNATLRYAFSVLLHVLLHLPNRNQLILNDNVYVAATISTRSFSSHWLTRLLRMKRPAARW